MNDLEFGKDLLKFAELLKPPEEENIEQKSYVQETAGCNNAINQKDVKIVKKQEPRTIEEFEREQEKEFEEAFRDTREEAVYDIKYRQAVTPEDVFLQMGAKTPATSSCEDMIVTIKLPGEKFSSLELEVSREQVKVMGFHFRVELPLPSPIDPDLSKANWDQSCESLILTLRMDREFDFINF